MIVVAGVVRNLLQCLPQKPDTFCLPVANLQDLWHGSRPPVAGSQITVDIFSRHSSLQSQMLLCSFDVMFCHGLV